jgi:hypothetical protein
MNERKFHHICAQLQSWEKGYISPSAQMAIKDAREFINELWEEVLDLKCEIDLLKNQKEPGECKDVEF